MDQLDWNELIDKHGNSLVLFARQWLQSHHDAEEAVQDSFIKVWRKWQEDPERITKPIPFLYTTVKRTALDKIKSSSRRTKREQLASEELHAEPMFTESETKESVETVEKVLKILPEPQKEVLVLKIWSKLTFREISEALDIPLDTAASRYRYALSALKKELQAMDWGV